MTAVRPGRDDPEHSVAFAGDPAHCTLLSAWKASGRGDLAAHLSHHGPLPMPARPDASWAARFGRAVEEAGLTGRGGAAFPAARKLTHIRAMARRPTVVVNAMEGEPASSKDHVLVTCAPHLVLDGAQLAARIVDAARVVVCVPAGRGDMALAVRGALAERDQATTDAIEVLSVPGGYVAGEESALVSWLRGGAGAPTWRPDKGVALELDHGPALVHNVETVAHMALIARYGSDAFHSRGRADAPGTTLVTVSGAVHRPGVYEHDLGTPLDVVVGQAGPVDEVAAVLTGGYGGSWVSADTLGVAYAPAPLAAAGGTVGAGVVAVLPRHACGITETAHVARFMAGQSAGQCGPCVFGLPAVAGDLEQLAAGRADGGRRARLEARCASVVGRGACRHPDGVARMVRSALSVFADDVDAHARGAPCAYHHAPSVLPVPGGGGDPR